MEFQDRILRCVDCGAEFVWTAGEQQFFADKNFKNEPKRCKACKAKRASRPAGARAARAGRNRDQVLGLRQGNDRAVQADAGASGLLQGMLPVPQIRRALAASSVSSSVSRSVAGASAHGRGLCLLPRAGAVIAVRRAGCLSFTSDARYLERFHADRRTDGRRRHGARPEGQDHPGRGRRTAEGQGQQPRQPGTEEDRAEPRRTCRTSTARASARSSARTRP